MKINRFRWKGIIQYGVGRDESRTVVLADAGRYWRTADGIYYRKRDGYLAGRLGKIDPRPEKVSVYGRLLLDTVYLDEGVRGYW